MKKKNALNDLFKKEENREWNEEGHFTPVGQERERERNWFDNRSY
jgi:hypothetical protein